MTLSNKVAVITGASAGIGAAIAHKFASEGCNLVLLARREDKLNEVKQRLSQFPVRVETLVCDVTNTTEVTTSFERIAQTFPTVHFLVNNAGYSSSASIDELSDEAFDQEIAVTLRGTHLCSKACLPLMNSGGAIVNLSSIRGRAGSPTSSPGYAAAKAGIVGLTKTYALQLAKLNIRVNAIAPGPIYPTEMSIKWDATKQQKIADQTVMKRLGKPEEVANVAYFLVSELSSFMTGQTLDVNGGNYMN